MTAEIIECEQGTEAWFKARLGLPTASMFATVQAKGKGGDDSKTRKSYLYKLAGEIITDTPMENYKNDNMVRGQLLEDEARELYGFINDAALERVGFIRNGGTGCSPDSLVADSGMLEIKTGFPHVIIDLIARDKFPAEHVAQCQGNLWIAEREWIDLICYWPRMPLFTKRAYRDEAYIKTLSEAVDAFNAELAEIVAKVRGYGVPKPASVKRHWSELSLPEQAGIRCSDEDFQNWMRHKHAVLWKDMAEDTTLTPLGITADAVRWLCRVESRAELGTDDAAAERWVSLNREYENWKHGT